MQVGQNASHNWKLIDNSHPQDLWFHLKSFPSPHVIAKSDCNIYECAHLCKIKSKYKNWKHIKVIYTPCSNVIKGNSIGEVFFKSNKKVLELYI